MISYCLEQSNLLMSVLHSVTEDYFSSNVCKIIVHNYGSVLKISITTAYDFKVIRKILSVWHSSTETGRVWMLSDSEMKTKAEEKTLWLGTEPVS